MERKGLLFAVPAALVLAIGMVIGLWFVGNGFANRDTKGITVSGSAELPATADVASWSMDAIAQGPSSSAAARAVLDDLAVLEDFLSKGGLPEADINVGGVTTSAVIGNEGPTGDYEASATIRVRSADVQLVKSLNEGIGEVLANSDTMAVNNNPPEYFISNLAELRPQVQQAAVMDAQNRAEVMVGALGGSLGRPMAATTGSVQVIRPDSVADEYGSYDLSTIDKSIRAVVTVTFEVK